MSDTKTTPQFSPEDLQRINAELSGKSPQDILKWAIDNVQGLYQTPAFGL
jgi:phosphoadenosine phosphosulfate reductase